MQMSWNGVWSLETLRLGTSRTKGSSTFADLVSNAPQLMKKHTHRGKADSARCRRGGLCNLCHMAPMSDIYRLIDLLPDLLLDLLLGQLLGLLLASHPGLAISTGNPWASSGKLGSAASNISLGRALCQGLRHDVPRWARLCP